MNDQIVAAKSEVQHGVGSVQVIGVHAGGYWTIGAHTYSFGTETDNHFAIAYRPI